MKITTEILSIPPYISTSWKNIASLHVENLNGTFALIVTLLSGARIEVPYLEPIMIETIFSAHAQFMEQNEKNAASKALPLPFNFPQGMGQILSLEIPLKSNLMDIENFGTLLQHNPEQAASPDLPSEVIEKIAHLSKTLGINDPNAMPQPEPDCNCMRCQIARAMQTGASNVSSENKGEEEIVTDEELKFQDWIVAHAEDKLYTVTNPLDNKEEYNVYLGEPIGCTCGEKHCEHIRAVLNS